MSSTPSKSPFLAAASRSFLLAGLLMPALAFAAIGKVGVLEGSAERKSSEGKTQALAVGTAIELNDVVRVGKKSNLKLVLTDGSVLMLGEDSELVIEEATFKDQERESFSARLLFGKVWAKVNKALSGSNAKFEVKTDRAVAGVRGTIFRVDALKLTRAATSTPKAKAKQGSVTVSVVEGRVAVEAEVKKTAQNVAGNVGKATGKRVQVTGPQEVSLDEWEKKFVELQRNQSVTVGLDLWEEAQMRTASVFEDSFGKFAVANGGGEE